MQALLVAAVLWVLPPGAAPQPDGFVTANGIGRAPARMHGAQARLMARRAAEVVAVRNLALKLRNRDRPMRYGSRSLHATIRGHRYLSEQTLPDGTVVVTVGIKPGGHLPSSR